MNWDKGLYEFKISIQFQCLSFYGPVPALANVVALVFYQLALTTNLKVNKSKIQHQRTARVGRGSSTGNRGLCSLCSEVTAQPLHCANNAG